MRKIETVALIGLGAVGASYLSRISENIPMENIRVVASNDRAARVSAGVVVNGVRYVFPLARPDDPPADLMIFAVKNHHLDRAIVDAAPHAGEETIIMSLLNGVSSEAAISESLRGSPLLSVAIGIDATRSGDNTVYSSLGTIWFGEALNTPGKYSPSVRRVGCFFDETGVPYEVPRDMKRALWNKLMINVGMNQTSAILRCSYDGLRQSLAARELARAAMAEVVEVASREGVILGDDDIEDAFARIDRLSPDGRTSMAQDVEAGRKTELDIFGTAISEFGRRHGVATPVNDLMSRMITAIEESYK
jgi:2-dehydropantoate 2-reductase